MNSYNVFYNLILKNKLWQKKEKKEDQSTSSLLRTVRPRPPLEATPVRLLLNTLTEIPMRVTSLKVFVREEVSTDMLAMEKSTTENGLETRSMVLVK